MTRPSSFEINFNLGIAIFKSFIALFLFSSSDTLIVAKSYPDLQILVSMSNQFDISLDTLLKVNSKMVQSMDKERAMGIKNQRVTKKVFQYIEQLKNIDTN